MDENQKYHTLGFVLLMTAIISVLSLCAAMLPGAAVLVSIAGSVLLCVFLTKSGFVRAMAAPVLSLLVCFLVSGNIWIAILSVLSFLLPGVLLALCVKHRFPIGKTIVLVGVGFLAYQFAALYVVSASQNQSIAQYFYTQVKTAVDTLVQSLNAMASSAGNQELAQAVGQLQGESSDLIDTILQTIPSVLILLGAALSYLIIVITKSVFKRMKEAVLSWKDFKDLRLDMAFSILMILSFIGIFLVPEGVVHIVLQNMLVIFMALLGFCGYTFADYFMVQKGLQRPLRILILIAVFILSGLGVFGLYFLSYLLVLIGLLDSSLNFRQRMNKGDGRGQA